MLRVFFLLFALMFASAASATNYYINTPNDGFLNLRYGPSTGYDVIRKMKHGQRVTILHWPGKWVKLRHNKSGAVGWAHSRYLSESKPRAYHPRRDDTHHTGGTRWVDAPYGDLNLRRGPGRNYPVLRIMRNGQKVKVLDRSGKWLLVRHRSGLTGWAHRKYLSKHRPEEYSRAPRHDRDHDRDYGRDHRRDPHRDRGHRDHSWDLALQYCRQFDGPLRQLCVQHTRRYLTQ